MKKDTLSEDYVDAFDNGLIWVGPSGFYHPTKPKPRPGMTYFNEHYGITFTFLRGEWIPHADFSEGDGVERYRKDVNRIKKCKKLRELINAQKNKSA